MTSSLSSCIHSSISLSTSSIYRGSSLSKAQSLPPQLVCHCWIICWHGPTPRQHGQATNTTRHSRPIWAHNCLRCAAAKSSLSALSQCPRAWPSDDHQGLRQRSRVQEASIRHGNIPGLDNHLGKALSANPWLSCVPHAVLNFMWPYQAAPQCPSSFLLCPIINMFDLLWSIPCLLIGESEM
jgi:hypothetical protein